MPLLLESYSYWGYIYECGLKIASFPGLRTAFVACSTKSVESLGTRLG